MNVIARPPLWLWTTWPCVGTWESVWLRGSRRVQRGGWGWGGWAEWHQQLCAWWAGAVDQVAQEVQLVARQLANTPEGLWKPRLQLQLVMCLRRVVLILQRHSYNEMYEWQETGVWGRRLQLLLLWGSQWKQVSPKTDQSKALVYVKGTFVNWELCGAVHPQVPDRQASLQNTNHQFGNFKSTLSPLFNANIAISNKTSQIPVDT